MARAQQARLRAVASAALALALAAWDALGRDDPGGDWTTGLTEVIAGVTQAQLIAATAGLDYAARAAAAADVAADAAPVASSLAGVASDGRRLGSLLWQPMHGVKERTAAGMAPVDALQVGRVELAGIVPTQILDAGRVATGLDIVSRPHMGYVRMVNPPVCGRCAILAGRHYRWSAGFQRHPHCDCIHIPAQEDQANDLRTDPRALLDAGQVHLSKADARAIKDGADLYQVVNARRGMYVAGGRKYTSEGTTRRGLAGQRLEAAGARTAKAAGQRYRRVQAPRLMPEQIYREAGDNREEALRLLRRFGYII